MVDFCPKCGAIIMGKKGEEISCVSCGYNSKVKTEVELKEKIETKKDIEIISSDAGDDVNPIIETECPECKHNEAYYWSKQMRSGDEPETLFYKCTKCKHQWRDYR